MPKLAPVPATRQPAEEDRDLVMIPFANEDAGLLQMLRETAYFNRRTLEQEILFRLDLSMDIRRVLGARKAA